jgi:signal transduction histidine kinase/CheY-like chemotaxis protein/HPt (histidine-containing phosphotransfer) domain-containing protein
MAAFCKKTPVICDFSKNNNGLSNTQSRLCFDPKDSILHIDESVISTVPHSAEQKQLVRAIRLGFAVVLTLTVILGGIGLYQLNSVNASMSKIVTVNNSKIALASAMRDAIRLRSLSINKMLATQDYFKRDAEILKFYDYARNYREAREQLLALRMDEREKAIIEKLTRHAQFSQPLVRQVAELLMENTLPRDFNRLFNKASQKQEELLELLDDSIELQKEYANHALAAAQQKFEYTMASFLLLLTVLLSIGIVIARIVVRYAGNKNKALALKNLELQKARAKADDTTRAKSEFLANMSHEIRTPLTTIIGFSETLVDAELSPKDRQRAVRAIQNSGKHLYDIINDVLDISKIEAGKLEMESVAVSPIDLVKDTVCIVEQKATDRGLQILMEFDLPLPKTLMTDPTRLKQILLNLCGNAVKFTRSGTVTIGVGFDAASRKMLFTVTDTGIGMSQEQVRKVFAPFHQADKSTTRFYGGTGLGLSISKQLARRLGGDITCSSEVGQGTRFTVSVSAGDPPSLEWIREVDVDGDYCATPVPHTVTPQLVGRVLLAEDTPDIQALITMLLEKTGLAVTAVDNGIDAVQYASTQNFDLLVMDMQMPVLDGLSAIQQLRESGFEPPIVALTANATQEDKNRCLRAGADNFVVKPVDVAHFYNVLSQYLPQKPSATAYDKSDKHAPLAEQPSSEATQSRARDVDAIDQELQQLINGFVNRLPETVSEITTYYRQQKWQDLSTSSHRLKGAGGTFGFPELSEISSKIMEQVRQTRGRQLAGANQPENDLRELIERLNQRCQQIVKKAS